MEQYIPMVKRGTVSRVPVNQVVYITRARRKIRIVTMDGPVEFYEKMENVHPFLDKRFYSCLNSLIINMDRVEKMENQTIYFANGEEVSIGRDSYIRSRQWFAAYLKKLTI